MKPLQHTRSTTLKTALSYLALASSASAYRSTPKGPSTSIQPAAEARAEHRALLVPKQQKKNQTTQLSGNLGEALAVPVCVPKKMTTLCLPSSGSGSSASRRGAAAGEQCVTPRYLPGSPTPNWPRRRSRARAARPRQCRPRPSRSLPRLSLARTPPATSPRALRRRPSRRRCTPRTVRSRARRCRHGRRGREPNSPRATPPRSPRLPAPSHGRCGHGPSSPPPPPATADPRHSRRRAELAMEPLPTASFLPKRPPRRVPYLPRKLIDQAAPSLTRRSAAAAT